MLRPRRHAVPALTTLAVLCLACLQPGSNVPEPDKEANKQVVRDVFAAIDAKDWDRLKVLIPGDAILNVAGSDEALTQEALLQLIPAFFEAFPDYHHVIEELVSEGDLVAARLTYRGTHEGEFEGIPATGNTVTYSGMQFFRVVDGVVKECWLIEDNQTFMSQLGMQLAPVAPETE